MNLYMLCFFFIIWYQWKKWKFLYLFDDKCEMKNKRNKDFYWGLDFVFCFFFYGKQINLFFYLLVGFQFGIDGV